MFKGLAGALVIIMFGGVVFGQFGGQWEINMSVFPSLAMENTFLELSYSFSSWTATSVSYFDSNGFTDQEFDLTGNLGPFSVSGAVTFNPLDNSTVEVNLLNDCATQTMAYTLTPPEYKFSWMAVSLTLGGAEFAFEVHHWAFPYHLVEGVYVWPCCVTQTSASTSTYMLYVFRANAGPFNAVANFEDCCTGITFKDFTLSFDDLSPCCGLGFDMEFYFTKAGFQYLRLAAENLPLCCGISFDVSIKFTETSKEVALTPKWTGLGEICYEIYGNVLFDSGMITGIDIYGFKLTGCFSECNKLEYVEAFDVDKIEEILGVEFLENETEYLRLHFCGPSCCNGEYTVDVTLFFQPSGYLFGLSRAALDLEVPVLSNMVFLNTFSITTSGTTELEVGWRITF